MTTSLTLFLTRSGPRLTGPLTPTGLSVLLSALAAAMAASGRLDDSADGRLVYVHPIDRQVRLMDSFNGRSVRAGVAAFRGVRGPPVDLDLRRQLIEARIATFQRLGAKTVSLALEEALRSPSPGNDRAACTVYRAWSAEGKDVVEVYDHALSSLQAHAPNAARRSVLQLCYDALAETAIVERDFYGRLLPPRWVPPNLADGGSTLLVDVELAEQDATTVVSDLVGHLGVSIWGPVWHALTARLRHDGYDGMGAPTYLDVLASLSSVTIDATV